MEAVKVIPTTKINFNTVSNLSGVSKTFLYNNIEINMLIHPKSFGN